MASNIAANPSFVQRATQAGRASEAKPAESGAEAGSREPRHHPRPTKINRTYSDLTLPTVSHETAERARRLVVASRDACGGRSGVDERRGTVIDAAAAPNSISEC